MKWDKAQPLYILYGCNIVKERSTMRLVAATTDEEMLKVIIGSEILCGRMDYRGFSNMKGFQQFRAACRNGDERYGDLSYGLVEKTENLLLSDCAKEPLYDADPAHVEEQRQKGIAEADKLIANKVLEAIRTMLRKDRETGAFEYAEARKAYYTERLICEILMALEQNAVNMGMEYDDCQKAMGGDLSKAAKKDWYLRHKDRGMEP